MSESFLFGIYYAIFLDAVGLAILGRRVGNRPIILQSALQFLAVSVGVMVQLITSSGIWLILFWLALILIVGATKFALMRYLGKTGLDLGSIRVSSEYFAPEMLVYLLLSLIITSRCLGVGKAFNISDWGWFCWYFALASTVVLTMTLGGFGLMAANLGRPIRLAVRVAVGVGMFALVQGCFRTH